MDKQANSVSAKDIEPHRSADQLVDQENFGDAVQNPYGTNKIMNEIADLVEQQIRAAEADREAAQKKLADLMNDDQARHERLISLVESLEAKVAAL